jgi:hypothetical protein
MTTQPWKRIDTMGEPERRARFAERMQSAREEIAAAAAAPESVGLPEHTITVEARAEWGDDDHMVDLLHAMDARPDLFGRAVGAKVRMSVIGVTVTVKAKNEKVAQETATIALIDEMKGLGLV